MTHQWGIWTRCRWKPVCALAFGMVALYLAGAVRADEPAGPDSPAADASDATSQPSADSAPQDGPATEAAVPLSHDKERYFYLEAYWQDGVNYVVKQRLLSIYAERRRSYGFARDVLLSGRMGFRVAVDGAAYVEKAGLEHIDDDIDVRRAFLYVTGDFFLLYPASFKIEMGAITQSFYVQSAWVRWRELPYVGTFKVGQYDAPFGLEAFGSSNDLTFMEMASTSQAFAPGTKFGLQIGDTELEDKLTWAFGWFADTQNNDVGDASDSLARLIGRATYLPVDSGTNNELDRRLLHVGLGVAFTYSSKGSVQYESRPESFLAPTLVDTGTVDASSAIVVGGESAWVSGPFSLQGEVDLAYVGGAPGGNPLLWGIYGYGSLLLSGETRPYAYQSGTFGHLDPLRPIHFWPLSGWGAWELGGRYSYVDLSDGDTHGGRMHGVTTGLNWYWNRYIRWQFNYQWMLIDDGVDDGRLHIFQARVQLVV